MEKIVDILLTVTAAPVIILMHLIEPVFDFYKELQYPSGETEENLKEAEDIKIRCTIADLVDKGFSDRAIEDSINIGIQPKYHTRKYIFEAITNIRKRLDE